MLVFVFLVSNVPTHLLRLPYHNSPTSPNDSVRGKLLLDVYYHYAHSGNNTVNADQKEVVDVAIKNLRKCHWATKLVEDPAFRDRSLLLPISLSALRTPWDSHRGMVEFEKPLLFPEVMFDDSMRKPHLTALLTPALDAVVSTLMPLDYVLTNSEENAWIRTEVQSTRTFMKPNMYIAHEVAVIHSPPTGGSELSESRGWANRLGVKLRFGECHWNLRTAVSCMVEIKESMQSAGRLHEAVGQIHAKVQCLLRDGEPGRSSYKYILCDASVLYLLEFSSTSLISLRQIKWSQAGSFAILLDFIRPTDEPIWLQTLRGALTHFKTKLVDIDAFLGHGAIGRVFHVQALDASFSAAIKVVASYHMPLLQHEILSLSQMRSDIKHSAALEEIVAEPRHDHLYTFTVAHHVIGGAALFGPVGATIYHHSIYENITANLLEEVFSLLVKLHRCGYTHGDPRLHNIIRLPTDPVGAGTRGGLNKPTIRNGTGPLMWIDFHQNCQTEPLLTELDATILLQSCFPSGNIADISELARRYALKVSDEPNQWLKDWVTSVKFNLD